MIIAKIPNLVFNNSPLTANKPFCGRYAEQKPDSFERNPKELTRYDLANEYLREKLPEIKNPSLSKLNIERLNGIQDGIEVFEGLSMAEIEFISSNLKRVLLSRGCRNNCDHCMVSAQIPPPSRKENTIHTIMWDDYLKLTDGYKELNNRLGFNAVSNIDYMVLIDDADPISLKSYDKNGKPHNIAEAIEIAHDTFNQKILFDTAGWYKIDKWSKRAAEDLVDYAKDNPETFYQFNISINPFVNIMKKSLELGNRGCPESEAKLRNIYTERMADVLMTFSPLQRVFEDAGCKDIGVLLRYAPDEDNNKGYTREDLEILYDEIMEKYEQKFRELPPEEQEELLPALIHFRKAKDENSSQIFNMGRGEKYYEKHYSVELPTKKDLLDRGKKYIDINGQIVVTTNGLDKASTDIQLNYDNRNKFTPEYECFTHISTSDFYDVDY